MKTTARLRRRILSREAIISVVGQGYVGLSLASAAAEAGFSVTGIDVDQGRVADLSAGELTVPGVDGDLFRAGYDSGNLRFASDFASVETSELVFICVPTPLHDGTPDLGYVTGASENVAAGLASGSLVILESTTYPGTTDQLVRPILETSGHVAGQDFLLAYSPERIDPGNLEYTLRNTPRVVGGHSPEATGLAVLFYEQLIDKVVAVSDCRAAELAKLLENTFRHVNIALVNEMAMLCHDMGIEVWEVIHAAATKPFGFMPFQPGPGVGGHCIPLDPMYLAWQVRRDAGRQFRILEEAQDINAQMPDWVVARVGEALNDRGLAVRGADILVLGVAYKPDVGDVRESPALKVIAQLQRRGAKVSFHDPFVESFGVNGHAMNRADLSERTVRAADCVVLLTPHSAYDLQWVADHAQVVFDARNAYNGDRRANVIVL